MPGEITFDIKGFEKTARRLKDPDIFGAAVRSGLLKTGFAIEAEAKRIVPVDTGRLRVDIHTEADRRPVPRWVKVGPRVFYARFIEFGTGIFGPRRRRIFPTRGRALAFRYRGKNVVVASIEGMRKQPFMRPALDRVARGDVPRIWRGVKLDMKLRWERSR